MTTPRHINQSERLTIREVAFAAMLITLLFLFSACEENGVSDMEEAAAATSSVTGTATAAPQESSTEQSGELSSTPEADDESSETEAASPTGDVSTSGESGASPTVADEDDGANDAELTHNETSNAGGGGTNQVRANNQVDGTMKFRASTQLNQIPGPNVTPTNFAYAYASCTDCQTFAVALQINLISRSADYVAPENAAVAINFECQSCYTVARAIQYTYSVDDPTQVPPEVRQLMQEFDRELRSIQTDKDITIEEAEARLDDVITQFGELAESLNDQRDETTEQSSPDATPEPEEGEETPTPEAGETPDDTTEESDTPEPAESDESTATPEEDATATP